MKIFLNDQEAAVLSEALNRRIEELKKAVQSPNLPPAVLEDLEASLIRRLELRAKICPDVEDYQLQADQENWLAQIRASYSGM